MHCPPGPALGLTQYTVYSKCPFNLASNKIVLPQLLLPRLEAEMRKPLYVSNDMPFRGPVFNKYMGILSSALKNRL